MIWPLWAACFVGGGVFGWVVGKGCRWLHDRSKPELDCWWDKDGEE